LTFESSPILQKSNDLCGHDLVVKMTAHSDPTFRNYQPLQAEQYAQARTSYPVALYNHVLKHHPATSGQFKSLLNVGCGPGNATRDMALAFEEAQGVDPGEEMIHAARSLGGKTKSGSKIRFEVCSAESCASAPGFEAGTVDLIISATAVCTYCIIVFPQLEEKGLWFTSTRILSANIDRQCDRLHDVETIKTDGKKAHWFDMPQFWEQVARLLRPGGTVALWTLASYYGRESLRPSRLSASTQSCLFQTRTIQMWQR